MKPHSLAISSDELQAGHLLVEDVVIRAVADQRLARLARHPPQDGAPLPRSGGGVPGRQPHVAWLLPAPLAPTSPVMPPGNSSVTWFTPMHRAVPLRHLLEQQHRRSGSARVGRQSAKGGAFDLADHGMPRARFGSLLFTHDDFDRPIRRARYSDARPHRLPRTNAASQYSGCGRGGRGPGCTSASTAHQVQVVPQVDQPPAGVELPGRPPGPASPRARTNSPAHTMTSGTVRRSQRAVATRSRLRRRSAPPRTRGRRGSSSRRPR